LTKILKTTLLLLLLLTLALFMLILFKEHKKPIKIEPIKVVSLSENQQTSSHKINKERVVSSKEEILKSLKETIAQQQR